VNALRGLITHFLIDDSSCRCGSRSSSVRSVADASDTAAAHQKPISKKLLWSFSTGESSLKRAPMSALQ